MGFQVSDKHIEEYHMLGYTVFRKILPPSLIRDLRQVSDRAKAIAREQSGPQVQRLQPVANYDLDQQPFIDYANLPPLVDAIAKVLTPRHRHGDRDHFGILFEPADMPYCTPWHRDWRDNMPPVYHSQCGMKCLTTSTISIRLIAPCMKTVRHGLFSVAI